jgi:geranylgeranyl pyrophosphate synthase
MFELTPYLKARAAEIEIALDGTFPPDETMPTVLHRAMRYAILSGGKRLRPIVAMAAAEALGAPYQAAMIPGIALEILHGYTLVHDDLPCMDDDDTRRGRPTVHIAFGEANAILAADALQAYAFGLTGSIQAPPPAAPTAFVTELADAAAAVVAGQVQDIAAMPGKVSLEELDFIHLNKTAYLFRAAARMGAIAAAANSEQLTTMTTFGTNLGIAFQLIDDLLDAAESGNTPEDDPSSSVLVLGAHEVRERAKAHTRKAISAIAAFGEAAQPLEALAAHMLERTI